MEETAQTARVGCDTCYAAFTGQPCWELWAARPAAHKPCCRKQERCEDCPLFQARTSPEAPQVRGAREHALSAPSGPPPRQIRVCPFLRVGTLPTTDPAAPGEVARVRARLRHDAETACRCTVRGAALVTEYVRMVCVSAAVDDCVFRAPEPCPDGPAGRTAAPSMPQKPA